MTAGRRRKRNRTCESEKQRHRAARETHAHIKTETCVVSNRATIARTFRPAGNGARGGLGKGTLHRAIGFARAGVAVLDGLVAPSASRRSHRLVVSL
jgi:hypothetical protein